METNTLLFEKLSDGGYAAKFVSTGPSIIQLERNSRGMVSVRANIPGMNPVPVIQLDNPYSTDTIFEVDMAAGIEITVISATEVNYAKIYNQ